MIQIEELNYDSGADWSWGDNRRPIIYLPGEDTIFIGEPGTHHFELARAIGIKEYADPTAIYVPDSDQVEWLLGSNEVPQEAKDELNQYLNINDGWTIN